MAYRLLLLPVCFASAARKIKSRSSALPDEALTHGGLSQDLPAAPEARRHSDLSQESLAVQWEVPESGSSSKELPAVPGETPDQGNSSQDSSAASAEAHSRGKFSQDCKPFPNQRLVLVTVNGDYVSFFRNWYHYAKPFLQATEHLYVVAENERAAVDLEELQKTHNFTLVKKKKEKETETEAAAALLQAWQAPYNSLMEEEWTAAQGSFVEAPYDSKNYGRLVMQRPLEILDLLDQGCTVLYSDIDAVWAKDPFLEIGAADAGNLYLTDDGDITNWLNASEPIKNYCTCFLYVQPHPATKQLMEAWSHGQGRRNQPPFNMELLRMPADSGLEKVVLPVERFPPGNLAKHHPDAAVFHANYIRGEKGKVEFFEQRNMWHGEPSSEIPAPRKTLMQRICSLAGLLC